MSGSNRLQRNARRVPEKGKMLMDDYDDPLDIDENVVVKHEVCPDIMPKDILPSEEEEVFGLVDGQELVEEHQRILYNMDMGPNDQRNIIERLGSLERKVDFLLNLNSKILARVDKICENMSGVEQINDFPIKDVKGLEAVDEKIANNRNKYIDMFKTILKPHGLVKHIGRFFETGLLMEMNYAGIGAKIGLSNYNNLNMALYESQRTEGFTIADHTKIVREAFLKAKNRVYKATSKRLSHLKTNPNCSKNKEHLFIKKSNNMIE